MKTSFYIAFGKDAGGSLLNAANQIKSLKKAVDTSIQKLDPRSNSKKYEFNEIIWAVILMLFLREESRNNMNSLRKDQNVKATFLKLFGIRIPHMDTCNGVLERVDPVALKTILSVVVSQLIERKLFDSARNYGRVSVTFDGTGIGTIEVDESEFLLKSIVLEEKPKGCVPIELFETIIQDSTIPKCTQIDVNVGRWATGKKSKNGKRYFTRQLLLLRIIGPNGLSIIVDWEPINTEDGSRKEDCEQNAAKRLLERFKSHFKRLLVTIIADGLYPNKTFIQLAEKLRFKYIFTLKDDSLKKLWKEINAVKDGALQDFPDRLIKPNYEKSDECLRIRSASGITESIFRQYERINGLDHAGSTLSWCSLCEYIDDNEKFYFSIITNIDPDTSDIKTIMRMARERFIIEDGFNSLKNRGFGLKHKFSRTSDSAAMNYITLMSVADILSNLLFSSDWQQRTYFALDEKYSIRSLVDDMKLKMRSVLNLKTLEIMRSLIPQKTTYSRPILG